MCKCKAIFLDSYCNRLHIHKSVHLDTFKILWLILSNFCDTWAKNLSNKVMSLHGTIWIGLMEHAAMWHQVGLITSEIIQKYMQSFQDTQNATVSLLHPCKVWLCFNALRLCDKLVKWNYSDNYSKKVVHSQYLIGCCWWIKDHGSIHEFLLLVKDFQKSGV